MIRSLKIGGMLLLFIGSMILQGCATNTTFGVPNSQWKTMNKTQRDQAIKTYNAKQKEQAHIAPFLKVLGAVAGDIASSPGVRKHTTSTHCKSNPGVMHCKTLPDGTRSCTQSGSSSCSSFGID